MSLMNSSNLPQLRPFTRTMVALGIVVSFLVVLLNMHTMVLERTREIGILKALGFSRLDVVQMLLGETLILASMGTGLGIALTFLTQAVFETDQPRADDSHFPCMAFFGRRARSGGSRERSSLSRTSRRQLRSRRRPRLRMNNRIVISLLSLLRRKSRGRQPIGGVG